MELSRKLAAEWRSEIEQLEKRAAEWETGRLRAYSDNVDVTHEQGPMLRRQAEALRHALALLEAE